MQNPSYPKERRITDEEKGILEEVVTVFALNYKKNQALTPFGINAYLPSFYP